MNSIHYYSPIDRVRVLNPEVIPLILHMRWFGEKIRSENRLIIEHPIDDSNYICTTKFHDIIWDEIDDSEKSPYRRARLRMAGWAFVYNLGIFAILEINLDNPNDANCKIKLSPVRFEISGRPKLPYEGKELEGFLYVVKTILNEQGIIWSPELLVHKLAELPVSALYPSDGKPHRELFKTFNDSIAWNYLNALYNLQVLEWFQNRGHGAVMTAQRFENVFGVKLPELE